MNDLTAFNNETAVLRKEATDIANSEIVQRGYQISGKPHATVFMNIISMATKRLRKHYPLSHDLKDPLYARLFAVVQKMASEVIKLKYECREQRVDFNHMKDLDRRVDDFFKYEFPKLRNNYLEITHAGN